MAKGDSQRVRNKIDAEGGRAQNRLDGLWDTFLPQNHDFWNKFQRSSADAEIERSGLTNQFQNYAKTGGISPTEEADIRARSVSPIRAVYANANRDVNRQRTLQGGYSPGFGTLKSRLAREASSGLSDATTNAEAGIAQMRQQGRQYGLSGASSMFSATPGMASLYGSMLGNSNQNLLGTQGAQNQLGLGLIQGQIGQGNLPSNFDRFKSAMEGIGAIGKAGAGVWSAYNGN